MTPDTPRRPLSRRALLTGGIAAAGLALAGCAAPSPRDLRAAPERTTPTPTPAPAPSAPPLLGDAAAYALHPGEVEPACKQAAVDFAVAVLSTGTVATSGVPLDARLAALGQSSAPAAPLLASLPTAGASTLEIVYPQYGGLTPDRSLASIMLVADHLVREAGTPETVERRSTTMDIRLTRSDGRWLVTDVLPAVLPAASASPSPSALAVLDNDRVVLPDAARADVLAGGVRDVVLDTLQELSARWRVHVQVLTAGHPTNVFNTDRVSNHTRGQAVDIWALDGVPVIDQTNCPWRELIDASLAIGATEVGGPQLVPAGGRTFSDQVHQDHVHVGYWSA